MSFVLIDKNNFEYSGLRLSPSTHFISSSIGGGVTGSNFVSPFRSKTLKKLKVDNFDLNGDGAVSLGELIVGAMLSPEYVLETIISNTASLDSKLDLYMSSVNASAQVFKNTKAIDVFRFDQPVTFNKNRNIKNVVRKNLMPYHKHRYQNCDFSYTNYNTLNFFNSDTIPSGSALLYPNLTESYDLNSQFSLNFWINPRYANSGEYKAGTIFHLSSSLCVSLVSGSSKDQNNAANEFKILVQLSQSCDKPPSQINLSSPSSAYPNDLVFTSSVLHKNNWHHVCVQWGNGINNNSGSIFIDDTETVFYVPSASVAANSTTLSPPCITVGNYFDAFYDTMGSFLNQNKGQAEGFQHVLDGDGITDPTITGRMLTHPLNAEIHELKLFNKVLFDTDTLFETERDAVKNRGVKNFDNLQFYVPPFFFPTTPTRNVIQTPFQTISGKTDDPFNVAFSFGVNGKMINLENFTRDFATNRHPRLLGLVPQTINTTIQNITADQYVYNSGSIKKRNMTILPNDNGLYSPNYDIYKLTTAKDNIKFLDPGSDFYDYSIINLENLIPSSSLYPGLVFSSGSIYDQIVGASPENPGVNPGSVLTIAQRTRDRSSNEIVIYDISNLYYGNRIKPGTFEIHDNGLTGSDGKIKIKLKDNEMGSLYRCDALTKHAAWNNVGNVLYDEGIAIVKTPHLFFLNKDRTEVKFKGEQNIHTMILNIPAFKDMFNSSSNPSFVSIPPSTGTNNEDLSTLYVTTVNIHDDNLNIIMKANFAQPIFKTEEDDFIIRLKEDF